MSLDGLRAWIGVVERKLTMRTRVFCVLVAIAIGGAAAGIYLALEAQDEAVTKSDLQAVRDEVASGVPATAPQTGQLEAEVATLREEVGQLRGELAGKGGGTQAGPAGGAEGGTEGSAGKTGGASAPQSRSELKEAGEEAIEKAGK